ncbi:unnamed protein product [Mytilus coruscus]|uniref:ALOG domain-containing protein n=1 Tax=Mytilus coruscus TaxID=42192 RepID=A0A6J8E664_MYTCO|nr:unnamed protein product [Mytilus coruscus]
MSLDSNAMTTTSGEKLKHFTLAPSPLSAGVNLFTQDVSLETNPYVYMPINIIFQVLAFLKEQHVRQCTFIAPLWDQAPIWLPIIKHHVISSFVLGFKGQKGIIEVPSKKGYILDNRVWKDSNGKTQIHVKSCINLGKKGVTRCLCPIRLASGIVENLISYLTDIFESVGRGRTWNAALNVGNPAASEPVKAYLKAVQEEQARAHIVPKRAKPIFINKVRSIAVYIIDRASDVAIVLSQEVKKLDDDSGFVFNHTFGKILRGGSNKCNTFVLKRCDDKIVCPVSGLESYYTFMKNHGISLKTGYLFRIITESGRVLENHVSYSSIYERFRGYLITLGILKGETPHSMRAGCAIMLALSDDNANTQGVMNHVGWKSERMAHYYTRANTVKDASHVACNLAKSVNYQNNNATQLFFESHSQYDDMSPMFN